MSTPSRPSNLSESIYHLIPSDHLSQSILDHVKNSVLEPIFNHSLRVYLLALRIAKQRNDAGTQFTTPSQTTVKLDIKNETLFVACMFHDMGTCPSCNGPQRFEVEGGDAAVTFLRSRGFDDTQALHAIWCAISLHTSVGIAERIDPFTWLVRMAVKADFAPAIRDSLGLKEYAAELESYLPRLHIEESLARAVVGQAARGEIDQGLHTSDHSGRWMDSVKFPKASWPGILLRGHLEKLEHDGPDWQGPNPAF